MNVTSFTALDHVHMSRALELASKGRTSTHPNPCVGCVLVHNGTVVGEGWHARCGGAHAEVEALARAGDAARGATAYVTLEPCNHHGRTPPCAQALIDAGVERVIVAMEDPFPQVKGQGMQRLRAAGIAVDVGLMADAAEALNAGFMSRQRRQRPWVRVKLATSLDGRTAMASGESRWITSDAARHDVQLWRARSSAILTGSGTVLADNPRLDVRLEGQDRQPFRVVMDSAFRTPRKARLFESGGTVWLVGHEAHPKPGWIEAFEAEAVQFPGTGGRPDLHRVMTWLGERQINDVHVEAGATLCGALMSAGLVDELLIYLAPHLMGDDGRGLLRLPGLESMADRIKLEWIDCRSVGDDLRLRLKPRPSSQH